MSAKFTETRMVFDGLSGLSSDLKTRFPEKKIADDWSPGDVVKALRKEFPERVL
jgi:hypothetical protein